MWGWFQQQVFFFGDIYITQTVLIPNIHLDVKIKLWHNNKWTTALALVWWQMYCFYSYKRKLTPYETILWVTRWHPCGQGVAGREGRKRRFYLFLYLINGLGTLTQARVNHHPFLPTAYFLPLFFPFCGPFFQGRSTLVINLRASVVHLPIRSRISTTESLGHPNWKLGSTMLGTIWSHTVPKCLQI